MAITSRVRSGDETPDAWAFSLPVIAPRLRGLEPPVRADENAVLVQPASGAVLADGIVRAIADTTLRRRIIAGGWELARMHTVETQSRRIAEHIANATGATYAGQSLRTR